MLGAGDPIRAKKAASICILITLGTCSFPWPTITMGRGYMWSINLLPLTLLCSAVSQVCSSGLILVLHNVWGKVYSNDPPVVDLVSRTLLFAAFLTAHPPTPHPQLIITMPLG